MHRDAFKDTGYELGRHVYDAIHDAIPKRPQLTEKSKRNKLPKLYAVWTGAFQPEGRRVKLAKFMIPGWKYDQLFSESLVHNTFVTPITRQDENTSNTGLKTTNNTTEAWEFCIGEMENDTGLRGKRERPITKDKKEEDVRRM